MKIEALKVSEIGNLKFQIFAHFEFSLELSAVTQCL